MKDDKMSSLSILFKNLHSSVLSFDANKRSLLMIKLRDPSFQKIVNIAYKHLNDCLNTIELFSEKQKKDLMECIYLNNIVKSIKPGIMVLGFKEKVSNNNFNIDNLNVLVEIENYVKSLEKSLKISTSENDYYSVFFISIQNFIKNYEAGSEFKNLKTRLTKLGNLINDNNFSNILNNSIAFRKANFESIGNFLMFKHFVANNSFGDDCVLTKESLIENKKFWKETLHKKMESKEDFYSLELQVLPVKNVRSAVLDFADIEEYYQSFMNRNDIDNYTKALSDALHLVKFKDKDLICNSPFFNELLDKDTSEIACEVSDGNLKIDIKSILAKMAVTIFKKRVTKQSDMPKILQSIFKIFLDDIFIKRHFSLNVSYDDNYIYFKNYKGSVKAKEKIVEMFNVIISEHSNDFYGLYSLAGNIVLNSSNSFMFSKKLEEVKDSIEHICEHINMANSMEDLKTNKIKIKKW